MRSIIILLICAVSFLAHAEEDPYTKSLRVEKENKETLNKIFNDDQIYVCENSKKDCDDSGGVISIKTIAFSQDKILVETPKIVDIQAFNAQPEIRNKQIEIEKEFSRLNPGADQLNKQFSSTGEQSISLEFKKTPNGSICYIKSFLVVGNWTSYPTETDGQSIIAIATDWGKFLEFWKSDQSNSGKPTLYSRSSNDKNDPVKKVNWIRAAECK